MKILFTFEKKAMTILKDKEQITITLPANVEFLFLQDFLDYLKVKSIVARSKAKNSVIDKLAEQSQTDWWKQNKKRYGK
ncbi:MAG: hypothetical protein IPP29_14280 [Bacteroidetes bacterium]|nr:hypothetical protein [Bacteroidota bacterium]